MRLIRRYSYFVTSVKIAVYSVLFSCFSISVQAQQDTYKISDLQRIYKSKLCENEPTCFVSNSANIQRQADDTFESQKCFCDEDCIKYKDCCVDSDYYKVENQLPPLPYCSPTKKIYMTVNCSEMWPNDDTKEKCEKCEQSLEEDMTIITPVTNTESRVTYGNIYCAICNYDFNVMNDIYKTWNLTARCGKLIPDSNIQPPFSPSPYDTSTFNGYRNKLQPRICLMSDKPSNLYLPPDSYCQYEIKMNNPFNEWHPHQIEPKYFVLDINLYLYEPNSNGNIDNKVIRTNIPVTIQQPNFDFNSESQFTRRDKRYANSTIDFETYAQQSQKIAANVVYDPRTKNWFSRYDNENFICYFDSYLPAENDIDVRKCTPNVISNCSSYKYETFVRACHTRTALIRHTFTGAIYRNIDCARCNNVFDNLEYCPRSSYMPLGLFENENLSQPNNDDSLRSTIRPVDHNTDFPSQFFNDNRDY